MIEQKLNKNAKIINDELKRILKGIQENGTPNNLIKAMRHGTIDNEAKRIRPFLVTETAKMFGVAENKTINTACAVELAHCYSLIHDDLPAMDNDDTRRGKPTVHKKFGEDVAILAGDALLTLAFEIIADKRTHKDAEVRTKLTQMLAQAISAYGMVGGQALDMEAETKRFNMRQIKKMQEMKTARLIQFSCEAGGVIGNAKPYEIKLLSEFGRLIGLMFQITDDIIDVTGNKKIAGKKINKDNTRGKQTLVQVLGVQKTKIMLEKMNQEAEKILNQFPQNTSVLNRTQRIIMTRKK